MRVWQHRLNRVFGWSAAGAAALYFGLILTGVLARLLGFRFPGALMGLGTFAFLLMILAAPAWALSWAAGWGNAPAGPKR